MKQLFILRHAKSDWSSDGCSDFDRTINKRGEQSAVRMGQWMHQKQLIPDLIISSTALRAKQTISSVCNELGIKTDTIYWNDKMYLASLTTLLNTIAETTDDIERLMIVGHNPGLEELVMYLSSNNVPRSDNGNRLCENTNFDILST